MKKETRACKLCGEPTNHGGTKLCNACWEIDSRLGRLYMWRKTEAGRAALRELARMSSEAESRP